MTSVDLSDQVAISAAISYILERLKKSDRFPLLNQSTDALNRLFCYTLNLAIQLGVGFAWSGTLWDGGTLTITVPSIWTMYDLAKGLVVQEGIYRKFFKPPAPEPQAIPPLKWDSQVPPPEPLK